MMTPTGINGLPNAVSPHEGTPRGSIDASSLKQVELEEKASLLEEGRSDHEESATPTSSKAAKRHSTRMELEQRERPERKRLSKKGFLAESTSLSDSLQWLWGGSSYSGVLCMAGSAVSYSFMGLLVKLLAGAHQIPSFQTVMVRCIIISIIAAGALLRMGQQLLPSPPVRLLLLARCSAGFVALSCFFYSIQVLPLRDATVLNFTMPVFTAVVARIFLNETWGLYEMAGAACSIVGVLLVTQPPLIFGDKFWGQAADLTVTGTAMRHESLLGIGAALLAAAMGAVSYVLVRSVGLSGEPPLVSVLAFAAFSVPASAICLLLFQVPVMPGPLEAAGMLLVGLTALSAQILLTRGLQLEKAFRASAMQYIKVVTTYLLGVLFLGEVPTVVGFVGALLIAASAAFIAIRRTE